MNTKKIVITILAILILVLIAMVLITKSQNQNITNEMIPAPVVTSQDTNDSQVNEEAKKITDEKVEQIMNDNITGTVDSIDANSITVKAEDGTSKTMPMEDGKTFVISQSNNTMENKQISDIKVGDKVFAHFEKETNLATTITLLQ